MMKSLDCFLESDNETYQACGAFDIIVLARVIVDVDQVGCQSSVVFIKSELAKSY